jgi:hypothetical protein
VISLGLNCAITVKEQAARIKIIDNFFMKGNLMAENNQSGTCSENSVAL